MPAITNSFMASVETRMRTVATNDYNRVNKKSWWSKVAKKITTESKKERVNWLLDTAKIERPNAKRGGGQAIFEDIAEVGTEFEPKNAVAGLTIKREKFQDVDQKGVRGGEGYNLASHWAKQAGAQAAYWPQKDVATTIKANPTGYDGVALFHTAHPINPLDVAAGTYANLFTGAASGSYPGACPLAGATTVEAALANLQRAIAYIASIKHPNGEDPRNLRVAGIMHPPAMAARIQQLTNAKFIAQSAASGAISGDVEAVIRNFGLGEPIEAPELGANFGGADDACFLLVEDILSDELGGIIYVEREPFSTQYHDEMTDAELARKREFQWTCEGRNTTEPGHPYLIFRLPNS